ncbi:MAG: hypothetical protein GAK41_01310 [Burkholderia gladioli]|nr:MAG: hypothetical protein GAK41_01310 [Burkholderia gladioli]
MGRQRRNQPISPDTLQNVLGPDTVINLANKAGIDPSIATGLLAQVLPHLVNHATPDGEVPVDGQLDHSSLLGSLSQLAGLFGGNKRPESYVESGVRRSRREFEKAVAV